jgi:hypothetical protein
MPALSMFFGLIVYIYAKDNQRHHKSVDNNQSGRPDGKLKFGSKRKYFI